MEKVKNSFKKKLIVNQYTMKYLKVKLKSYNGKFNTNLHNNKIPKESSQCIYLSVILIDSVFRRGENCYP